MINWTPVPPLIIDDDTGEPLFAVYDAWFLSTDIRLAVTRSQYQVFRTIAKLCQEGVLMPAQAKIAEASFFINGWEWVDDPVKQQQKLARRPHTDMIRAAILQHRSNE